MGGNVLKAEYSKQQSTMFASISVRDVFSESRMAAWQAECEHFPRVVTRDENATWKELFSNEIRNRVPCLGGEQDFEVDGFEFGGAKEWKC